MQIEETELQKIGVAYLALLEIPLQSQWRALNQPIYAACRDRIAELMDVDRERIQTIFEEKAYGSQPSSIQKD